MKKLTYNNCLAFLFPEVAAEWHPTKNNGLNPKDVAAQSNKKYWFKCIRGHEWQSSLNHRCGLGRRCPYCAGQRATPENCLALFPKIACEWHPAKNGDLTPKDVLPKSGKKCWWKCQEGHEWQAAITSRHVAGCPYCAGRKATTKNCLGTLFPEVAKEWHTIKNGNLTPRDVVAKSSKKYWWKCKIGHEYYATPHNRNGIDKCGCPYCSGRKVCYDNCLATLFPGVASEWHPILNGDLTSRDVVFGSTKKVWWKCREGHEWMTKICVRTSGGCGCPVCKESQGEKSISKILTMLALPFKRQCTFSSCKNIRLLPFDFVVEVGGVKKIIEYQGEQHYIPRSFGGTPSQTRAGFENICKCDVIKRNWCKLKDIPLLEIPYWEQANIELIVTNFLLL